MTLEQAHKLLDEEYAKNETVEFGFKKGKVPDSVRVTIALIKVTEIAKEDSVYFIFRKIEEE